METTKKAKTKNTGLNAAEIQSAYRDYLLTHGKQPASVFSFSKEIGITESEFYTLFASFASIEKSIWEGFISTTVQRLTTDEAYAQFTAQERVLTFYFSLVELLKNDRSFVLHQLTSVKAPTMLPDFIKGFKKSFEEWINSVLAEAKSTGEVAKRPFLDDRYHHLFWLHLWFILQFWAKDQSPNFEKTDAAIEKSVTLAFELIGKGVLDNALDFGKFLYQNSKN